MTKCPQCGYNELPETKQQHSIMNVYVNKSNPKEVVAMNRKEDSFTASRGPKDSPEEVEWVKQSIWEDEQSKAAVKASNAKNKTVVTPPSNLNPP